MSNLFNFFFEKVGYYMKCVIVISMAYTKKLDSIDNPKNEFQDNTSFIAQDLIKVLLSTFLLISVFFCFQHCSAFSFPMLSARFCFQLAFDFRFLCSAFFWFLRTVYLWFIVFAFECIGPKKTILFIARWSSRMRLAQETNSICTVVERMNGLSSRKLLCA